jgi:hypothetical protein
VALSTRGLGDDSPAHSEVHWPVFSSCSVVPGASKTCVTSQSPNTAIFVLGHKYPGCPSRPDSPQPQHPQAGSMEPELGSHQPTAMAALTEPTEAKPCWPRLSL